MGSISKIKFKKCVRYKFNNFTLFLRCEKSSYSNIDYILPSRAIKEHEPITWLLTFSPRDKVLQPLVALGKIRIIQRKVKIIKRFFYNETNFSNDTLSYVS